MCGVALIFMRPGSALGLACCLSRCVKERREGRSGCVEGRKEGRRVEGNGV